MMRHGQGKSVTHAFTPCRLKTLLLKISVVSKLKSQEKVQKPDILGVREESRKRSKTF